MDAVGARAEKSSAMKIVRNATTVRDKEFPASIRQFKPALLIPAKVRRPKAQR